MRLLLVTLSRSALWRWWVFLVAVRRLRRVSWSSKFAYLTDETAIISDEVLCRRIEAVVMIVDPNAPKDQQNPVDLVECG